MFMSMRAIHKDEKGWWFWDETWADRRGPYPTRKEVEEKLIGYLKFLKDGEP